MRGWEPLEARRVLDSTVVFSEVMYHPRGDAQAGEWIELQSLMAVDMDMSHWRLDGVDFQFPDGTILPARQRFVIAAEPEKLAGVVDASQLLGPYTGSLSNGGESLRLINNSGRVMDQLDYDDAGDWPAGADGSGSSLAKRLDTGGTATAVNWRASRQVGGTPGAPNEPAEVVDRQAESLAFAEVSEGGAAGWVELVNQGAHPVDLNGYRIGSSADIRTPTPLPARQLAPSERQVITFAELGLTVRAGDRLFLWEGSSALIDDVLVAGRAQARLAGERFWWTIEHPTPGQANQIERSEDLVISEIMYHAPGFPAVPDQPATYALEPLVDADAQTMWRYRAAGAGLTPDWAQTAHASGADGWQVGPAPIGFDRDALPQPLRTILPSPATVFPPVRTYYFETEFTVTAAQVADAQQLILSLLVDDGALVFLNGQELYRVNLPFSEVTSATLATATVDNAIWSDPVAVGSAALQIGVNRISVEVHQDSVASADVAFAMTLALGKELTPFLPGVPYRESQEEWIELTNRSQETSYDLSGWQLADAVAWEFAAGTMLGPGESLIVAADPEAFSAQYPHVARVVGPWSGGLSNSADRVRLLDRLGNPADDVPYFDGGRWPAVADGGGGSLELRDLWADNSVPESWAASLPVETPPWQTIRYRAIAAADGTTNGITSRFQEFILGLLDAGEVMIDDVAVIEAPDGAAIDRVQNGDFQADTLGGPAAKWRINGTHSGTVVTDPWDASNQVLKLTATGALEDRFNHAETTFADGARIQLGQEYEISLRALWLNGSNQLNTRLYFNRAARTHSMSLPRAFGTPGARNSTAVANTGPTYAALEHSPVVPAADETVTVRVAAEDPQGIAQMTLWYGVQGDNWQSVQMTSEAGPVYVATIPGFAAAETIQFYVQGQDTLGATSTFPAAGPESRALYKVQDNRASTRGLHNFRIVMIRPDATRLHTPTNQLSNGRMGATVIYNEQEVFYDVGVRLKGSNAGRGDVSFAGFNVSFDPMQRFRGVHDGVAIDRSGRSTPTPRTQDELLIKQIALRAGEIPMMVDDLVQVLAPNTAYNRPALLMMARYGDEFLESQYENGSDGTRFRLDIAYVPRSTQGNNPENPKLPNPYDHPQPTKDLEDLGDDKELYRTHLLIRNNLAADDYSVIIAAAQAMDQPGSLQRPAAEAVIDVDQWARVFALQSLTGVADTYTRGQLHHNIEFYVRPEDDKVLAFPWDWDFAFTAAPTQLLIGRDGNTGRLLNTPGVRRLVYGHLLDIMQKSFSNEYLDRWIDHYGAVAGQNLAPIKSYVASRRSYVLGRLPATTPFEITTNGGQPMTVDQTRVTLQGRGWIDVRAVRWAGAETPLALRWLDDEQWEIELPLRAGENQIRLEALGFDNQMVGTAAISVTSTVPNPLAEALRLTEINYHPAPPSLQELAVLPTLDDNDFEFLELANLGAATLDLTQVRWTEGVTFTFGAAELAPGEHGVLVSNPAAFPLRYGTAARILGAYSGSLANGGETLRAELADGTVLWSFAYGDRAPWPMEADGAGATLELRDLATDPAEYGNPSRWRASLVAGGTPGAVESFSPDVNGDGRIDVDDIDAVCAAIARADTRFDLNQDQLTNLDDLQIMLDAVGAVWGDVNLDGAFNSRDLVELFQRGEYEDGTADNSTWAEGDWNCDGDFTSADFVLALQRGSYAVASRPTRLGLMRN